jgi:hypothetical protein
MSACSAVTSKEIGVAFPQQLRKSDADQVTRPISGLASRRRGADGPPSDRNGATVVLQRPQWRHRGPSGGRAPGLLHAGRLDRW